MKRVLLATAACLTFAGSSWAQTPEPAPTAAPAAPAAAETPKWDVQNPPGPSRDVSINVTRGTWMSLDVSPDGQTIVFDLLGDIYVMPIAGGEARAIASGVAWDMQPKWSPDGRHIAFTSDRGGGDNIWVMDADGSNPTQVSKETFRLLNQPEWTPDGEFIIARKHFTSGRSLGAGELWMYHRAGGGGVQMTERRTQQKDTGEPAVSPDGRYVYFSDDATPGGVFEYSKDPNTEIYVIRRLDRETGQIEPYITGPGGSIRPTPSPDGRSLAFIRRVRYQSVLYVMDIESGRETPVFSSLDRDMQETWAIHGLYPSISWTPDNRSIVFWADGRIQRVDVGSQAVADIPFHVADTRRVQETVRFPVEVAPNHFDVKMIRWARPSPDGSRVVFEALGNLWIRDLPTGTARRLTRQSDHFELYPNWSRDGRSIVYTTWDDQDFGTVRVVSANGGEGRVVTPNPGHYVEPTFSPDGRTIVYRTVADGYLTSALWSRDPGVYRIPTAGGAPVHITDDGQAPQFGADGDRLFLSGRDGDKRTLVSVDLNGQDKRTHLTSEWASEFAVSPDGRWLGWTERFNAYVAPFAVTGRPITVGADGKSLPQARVTRDAGEWLSWSGDSHRLQWSLGPELFSRDLNQAFTFVDGAPAELPRPDERGINLGFSVAADKPEGRIALTGARLITMNGEQVIENGVIIIDGNRIEAIGPAASTPVPAGVPVMDMSGKTIMPGLVDAHWHGSMGSDEIIPEQSWVDYAALAFGVTTLHDPSNDTSEIFAHSELARAGRVVGPRIFSTGTVLYGAATPTTAQIDNLADARSTLRRMQAAGAWSVKSYNQPRRDQRQQIIAAARELDMMVVPEGGSLFHQDMSMIVDGHTTIEHSIPLDRLYDDVHQLWSQTGTAYNPTLIVAFGGAFGENYWYQESNVWDHPILTQYVPRRILDARARRPVTAPDNEWNHIAIAREAHRLNEHGVSVSIGAHGQREGLGAHWELWGLAQGGMTPLEAIRAGTLNGARALGMDRDIGSLEVGKLADMVVMDANPLENIRNTTSIAYTIANGRVYDSHMDEVAPRRRPRQPFWFTQSGGETWAAGVTATETHGHGHD
ncbi:amidohydrolase family protein [Brevundimonas lenta]|uniref:Imidazolonepropionase-like amidohydrolase/Tol biopolymer transport system component n=1 Tax=Brevundimonas lenta TaxID=424796 RepID=A0A7W6JBU4_9CAUL|nr:amidohydrolase family protein [Brevundimonas lenta]MBB4081327.1 imidazolonepropionase-like amidohydrolase/Tol biopolymer transport system component [Brevundimonas lenta]